MKIIFIISILIFNTISILFADNDICNIKSKFKKTDKGYVMVAAHRGDWRNYADNSLEGIISCIKMGVDIVEIDVAMTKDSVLILMHDKTIDRTTNGTGYVSELTYEYISSLYLKNGLGRVSEVFKVPTLYDVMMAVKGRVFINIDKADKYFNQVYKVLKETETLSQVIIKSSKPYEELCSQFGNGMKEMIFMPVVNISKDSEYIECNKDFYLAYEVVVPTEAYLGDVMSFYSRFKDKSHLWINTLWSDLSGGYIDDKSIENPDANWGYWIDFGASILQTDRPDMMLKYLRDRGLHD